VSEELKSIDSIFEERRATLDPCSRCGGEDLDLHTGVSCMYVECWDCGLYLDMPGADWNLVAKKWNKGHKKAKGEK